MHETLSLKKKKKILLAMGRDTMLVVLFYQSGAEQLAALCSSELDA